LKSVRSGFAQTTPADVGVSAHPSPLGTTRARRRGNKAALKASNLVEVKTMKKLMKAMVFIPVCAIALFIGWYAYEVIDLLGRIDYTIFAILTSLLAFRGIGQTVYSLFRRIDKRFIRDQ